MDGPILLKLRARALTLARVGSTFAPSIPARWSSCIAITEAVAVSRAARTSGIGGELGQERTPERHIKNLVSVCRLRLLVWRARPERR
jgi:hypothetical protein